MSKKTIRNAIETYQRQRLCFIQTISTLANNKNNIELLMDAEVLDLIIPLLNDTISSIRLVAFNTIGKILICSNTNTEMIIQKDLIPLMMKSWNKQNTNNYIKKTAMLNLKCAANRDIRLAKIIVEHNVLQNILECLKNVDKGNKEVAAMVFGSIGKHSRNLAQQVVDCGAVPVLIQMLRSHELSLKYASTYALHNICKHSLDLSEHVVDCGVIPLLLKALDNSHLKLKQESLACLADIVQLSPELAEIFVSNDNFSSIVNYLMFPDDIVQKNSAALLRDIAKHNLRLANTIVQHGGLEGLINLVAACRCASYPAMMALGYIAAQSEQISSVIIEKGGILALKNILICRNEEHLQAAAVWSLSQIGKHSVEHAEQFCKENVLPILADKVKQSSSEYLKNRCRNALSQILPRCRNATQLGQLILNGMPEDILVNILCAFIKILPNDSIARRNFVTSGCLRVIQDIHSADMKPYVETVNLCFPNEIVQYVSPGFPKELMEKIDSFVPGKTPFFADCNITPSSQSINSLPRSETSNKTTL